jgi:hypothetical protein
MGSMDWSLGKSRSQPGGFNGGRKYGIPPRATGKNDRPFTDDDFELTVSE